MAHHKPNSGIPLGRILGIPIYLHPSWFIIFALITLSLRTQFASQNPGWTPAQHWMLGIVTSVLFFGSVVFHELCHSMVAMRCRIRVDSITLFVFGGLAKIQREAEKPIQEIGMAIAGPISSLFLAGCFWLVAYFSPANSMLAAASKWLWQINLILALFNLLPGFPLDGGRILRGIAWGLTKDLTRATGIPSDSGKFFAYILIFIGIWQALNGNWMGGLWMAFIGWFLLSAAQESYALVAIRNTLTGVRAEDVMTREVPAIPRDISLEEYFHEVLRTGRRCHVVNAGGNPVGLMMLHAARSIPREEWDNTSVQAVMLPLERIHSAAPDEPVIGVLDRMQQEDINQMPVASEGHIVGMITRDTILRFLQTRLQLGNLATQ